jgi:hypothetical protein
VSKGLTILKLIQTLKVLHMWNHKAEVTSNAYSFDGFASGVELAWDRRSRIFDMP